MMTHAVATVSHAACSHAVATRSHPHVTRPTVKSSRLPALSRAQENVHQNFRVGRTGVNSLACAF